MSYTLKELRKIGKQLSIRGYSCDNKATLLSKIENHPEAQKIIKQSYEEQPEPERPDVSAAFSMKEDDLENLTAEELEEKQQKLQSYLDAKRKTTPMPIPPKTTPDGDPVVVKKARKARKRSAWDDFLVDYVKKNGGSPRNAMSKKEEYAEYKKTWKSAE